MKYSLLFRAWHWLNAFVILGLVGTVLLRWTLFSKTLNAEVLMNTLAQMNITVTQEQGIVLAKALRGTLWEWHIILGFIFAGLTLLRLYLHFINSKQREPFKGLDTHHKLVRVSYCGLYTTFVLLAATGLLIYFYKEIGISKDIAHSIKELHELVYYYVAFFIPLHIVGVFFADARKEKGLVSSMIHGKKN